VLTASSLDVDDVAMATTVLALSEVIMLSPEEVVGTTDAKRNRNSC